MGNFGITLSAAAFVENGIAEAATDDMNRARGQQHQMHEAEAQYAPTVAYPVPNNPNHSPYSPYAPTAPAQTFNAFHAVAPPTAAPSAPIANPPYNPYGGGYASGAPPPVDDAPPAYSDVYADKPPPQY